MNWISRDGNWKLVYRKGSKKYKAYELDEQGLVKSEFRTVPSPGGMQLYNLAEDPGETQNLADKFPERVAAMEKQYTQWRSRMADPMNGKKAK